MTAAWGGLEDIKISLSRQLRTRSLRRNGPASPASPAGSTGTAAIASHQSRRSDRIARIAQQEGPAVGLTYVEGVLTGPAGKTANVRFLVDSGATSTLVPHDV